MILHECGRFASRIKSCWAGNGGGGEGRRGGNDENFDAVTAPTSSPVAQVTLADNVGQGRYAGHVGRGVEDEMERTRMRADRDSRGKGGGGGW